MSASRMCPKKGIEMKQKWKSTIHALMQVAGSLSIHG